MNNVSVMLGAMHKFNELGQRSALQLLRDNRAILDGKYGFAKIPEIIASRQFTDAFENSMVGKKTTIRDLVIDILKKIMPKVGKPEYKTASKSAKAVYNEYFRTERVNALKVDFDTKKMNLVKLFKNDSYAKNLVKQVQEAKTPEELEAVINDFENTYDLSFQEELSIKYKGTKSTGPALPLECLQDFWGFDFRNSDFILQVHKIINNKSNDKAIKQIEDILKNDYGMEYVILDNIKDAQNILKTVEMAELKGVPVPKNIIVTPFIDDYGRNISHSDGSNTVIIKANEEKFFNESFKAISDKDLRDAYQIRKTIMKLRQTSTSSPLHVYMHDFIHAECTSWLSVLATPFPEKYDKIVRRLSNYARDNFDKPEEIRTELRTKEVLQSLSDEEKKVLNYFV